MDATTASADRAITDSLLEYLRDRLQRPELQYAAPPARITGGFDTQIYSFQLEGASEGFSGPLVARVFREDTPAEQARWESTVQNAMVGLGYPAPRVLLVCED